MTKLDMISESKAELPPRSLETLASVNYRHQLTNKKGVVWRGAAFPNCPKQELTGRQ